MCRRRRRTIKVWIKCQSSADDDDDDDDDDGDDDDDAGDDDDGDDCDDDDDDDDDAGDDYANDDDDAMSMMMLMMAMQRNKTRWYAHTVLSTPRGKVDQTVCVYHLVFWLDDDAVDGDDACAPRSNSCLAL